MIIAIILAILLIASLWFLCGSLAFLGAKELQQTYGLSFPEVYDMDSRMEFFAMGPMMFVSVFSRGIYILFIWRPWRIICKISKFSRDTWRQAEREIKATEQETRVKKGWDA